MKEQSSAQCLVDRHNTSVNDGWISCTPTQNPNPANGVSHWIQYNFNTPRNIYKTHVWNVNQNDYLLWGAKEIKIEYSLNGSTWSDAGNYTISRGTGSSTYQGSSGPDLQGISARYLLITILETYGGSCAGFGEWKFYTQVANTNQLTFDLSVCENDDIQRHINGGMNAGGTYSGAGVTNNYDDSFDFDPAIAGAGTHMIKYTYPGGASSAAIVVKECQEAYCPPCPVCAENAQADYDAVPVDAGIYYDEEIVSQGSVAPNTNVQFRGSNFVEMRDNFNANQGSEFVAMIMSCEENLNLLSNPSFDDNVTPWYINTYGPSSGTLTHNINTYYHGVGAATVQFTSPDLVSWHVQFEQSGHTVEANSSYTLSFAAKADTAFSGWCAFQLNQDPWTTYGGVSVPYTTEWQQFELDIQTTSASPVGGVRLTMNIGELPSNTVHFDNFVLIKNP